MEALFARLLPRVRKIVALRMGCRESELWDREDLVQDVEVPAHFVSKYELQGQWLRTTAHNPSAYMPGSLRHPNRWTRPVDLANPVEQVSWSACTEVCRRLGLGLPTEAQWEYSARAGLEQTDCYCPLR